MLGITPAGFHGIPCRLLPEHSAAQPSSASLHSCLSSELVDEGAAVGEGSGGEEYIDLVSERWHG